MDLEELRGQIDEIDQQLVRLLEARLKVVNQISAQKKTSGRAVLDPEREKKILDKVVGNVQNPGLTDSIVATFRDILKNSRDFQNKKIDK